MSAGYRATGYRAIGALVAATLATSALVPPSLAQSPQVPTPTAPTPPAPTPLSQTPTGEPTAAEKQAALADITGAADVWIEGWRAYRHVPAVSIALVNGDDAVWSKGYGFIDRAGRIPATADTLYSICSISKLFTSVALMQQWEAGTVRLDEPITTYLPWAKLAPDTRDSVPVTLRSALTHSAGLPRESDFPYWTGPDFTFPTQAQLREKIASQAPLYPVSAQFQYSNLGLTLVGETVEAASGQPYAAYIQDRILTPLKLADTRPFVPAKLFGRSLAVGWGALEADGSRPPLKLFDPAGLVAAAGYTSSVADLARFASWNMRVLRTGNAELLRASTLREMQRVQYETADGKLRWGLGYAMNDVEGTRFYGHGGACPGYRSSLTFEPKSGLGLAVAMNAMDDPGAITMTVLQLAKARQGAARFDPPTGETIALADYAGRYEGQPWGGDFALVPWHGGLIEVSLAGEPLDMPLLRLKPLGKDRFQAISPTGDDLDVLVFQRDAKGAVSALVRHSNRSPRLSGL